MTKVKKSFWVVLVGIAGIVTLDVVALCHGIDGVLMTSCIAAIAAMVGLVIPTPKGLKM